LKIAVRSLARVRALWITVALTLALGIGANAAIFSVVRAVLLRRWPIATKTAALRAAERAGARRRTRRFPCRRSRIWARAEVDQELGTFSEIDFTIVGLGTPREIPAGVVDGTTSR
jgi:putative ABC transport system permease protein